MMNFRHPSAPGEGPQDGTHDGADDDGLDAAASPDTRESRRAEDPSREPQGTLTIREMCDRFGVTARTLRFYEASGLMAPLRNGTRRHYTPADCARLSLILRAKRLGFTLDDSRALLSLCEGEGGTAARRARMSALGTERLDAMERQYREIGLAIADLRRLLDAGPDAFEAHLRTDAAA